MKRQTKKYLEYRILITPDVRSGSRERCYAAFVPVLSIATDGDTVELALENAKNLIEFHLESLRAEKRLIPTGDSSREFIATARVAVPA